MKAGFYWVRFGSDPELTVGKYTPTNPVGETNRFPWELVASDNVFTNSEITVVCECIRPTIEVKV